MLMNQCTAMPIKLITNYK